MGAIIFCEILGHALASSSSSFPHYTSEVELER